MRICLAIIFLFLSVAGLRAKETSVRVDSSRIAVRNANVEKEKEIFADDAYHYDAEAKESKNWLRAFWEWLTEKIFGRVTMENAELTWQIVKWTLISLFIAGIIIVIWKSKFRGMLRKGAISVGGASFSDLPEDIESVNLDKLIEEAMRAGNYRLAVRWCFLKSLQLLSQKKMIDWRPAKTNVDYQHELKAPELRERFDRLSHVFEYVWYGEMSTSEQGFAQYRSEVEKFNTSLHA